MAASCRTKVNSPSGGAGLGGRRDAQAERDGPFEVGDGVDVLA
jgi:hypothetical protein